MSITYQSDINCRKRNDFTTLKEGTFETFFIEINLSSTNSNQIGVIYHPPNGNYNEFINTLECILDKISNEHKFCYLLGDFNTNLLNLMDSNVIDFLNIMSTFLLRHLINRPTRFKVGYNPSMLDNIFTNVSNNTNIKGGVLSHL